MTRQEFIEDVNAFWELIEFCRNERLDICDDLVYWDKLDSYIMCAIRDFDTWQGIRDFLSDIPDGGEYYSIDGYDGIVGVDDTFDDYKSDVIRAMDQCNAWGEEEDSSDDEDDVVESETQIHTTEEEEEVSIDDASFLAVVGGSA